MAEPTLSTPDSRHLEVRLDIDHDTLDRAQSRFITAAHGTAPTSQQRAAVKLIGDLVIALGAVIEANTPRSRNQSLALTALEDVQMRANRAIFATGPSA